MLCENCGKNNANVKYTEVINGNKKEMHLCEECSKKLGIEEMSFNMPSLDFSNFFGDLFNEYDESNFLPSFMKEKVIKCNKCGMTFDEFTNIGKFGCDECYNVFSSKIDSMLKNIHGDNRHIGILGKISKTAEMNLQNQEIDNSKNSNENISQNNKVNELKEKLKQLVKEEKYEEAAKVRDEIKKEEGRE